MKTDPSVEVRSSGTPKAERFIRSAAVSAAHTVHTGWTRDLSAVQKRPQNGESRARARIALVDIERREPPRRRRSANCIVSAKSPKHGRKRSRDRSGECGKSRPFSLTPALSRWEREPVRPRLGLAGRARVASDCRRHSLSQREGVGVRENRPAQSATRGSRRNAASQPFFNSLRHD